MLLRLCITYFALVISSYAVSEHSRTKRDIVSPELSMELSTQIHRAFVQRLMIIDQLETVVNGTLAQGGGKWLGDALRMLSVLREDIKHTGVKVLAQVHACYFQFNLILHESKRAINSSRSSARRSVSDVVNEMGLNFTILTLEQSQANYKTSLQLIDKLDEKLRELLADDPESLDMCRPILDELKSMVATYENRMLMIIHETILTLNQIIQQARQFFGKHQQHDKAHHTTTQAKTNKIEGMSKIVKKDI